MMKTTSANRMTKMKVIENGAVVKTVANASINYGQDLLQLKKMIEIAIRLSPQDPVYTVDKISIEVGDGKYSEVSQDELLQIQNSLFKVDPSAPTSMGSKVSLKIYVTRPTGPTGNRAVSRMRDRENRDTTNTTNNENAKYENIMRPPSPLNMRRNCATPSKIRAPSRGRFVAAPPRAPATPAAGAPSTPAAVPRGASPMRLARTPAPTPVAAPSDEASASAPSASVNASRVPFAPVSSTLEEEVPMDDMMPPASASKSARKPRRLTQVDMEEEERKKIMQAISQTWTEVSGEDVDPGSPKSFLAPFAYYSPTPRDEENSQILDDEDFQSCAGDMGDLDLHEDIAVEEQHLEAVPEDTELVQPAAASEAPAPSTPVAASKMPFASPEGRPAGTPKRASMTGKPGSALKSAVRPVAGKSVDPSKPVYPDGRTLAESSVSYEHSLRTYRGTPAGKGTPGAKKKAAPKAGGGDLSPLMRKSASSRDGEGRPSIGTITTQWEFMRTAFVNNSDEELEWLMVSKKAGAYTYAHRKHQAAEDKYFKSLFEIDFYQTQVKTYSGAGAKLPSLFNDLGARYAVLMATPKDEPAGEAVLALHRQIKEYIEKHGGVKTLLAPFPPKVEQQLLPLLAEEDKFRIVRKARDFCGLFASEVAQLQHKFVQAQKDSDNALESMEKWAKREVETEEYPRVMKEQEEEWLRRELEDNTQALAAMREHFPDNVFDLTVPELQQQVRERGGLLSLELAQELKTNKLLHWLVTHPDDIATSSFLTGDRKAYFENIESLDIIELRALAMILPAKFELDNDGRKAEWRTRFMNRAKQLVTQQRGESVKGSWDQTKGCRAMVELPPLKPDQLRRGVYFYRTKEASDAKLKQFDDKLALLTKKEAALAKAEQEAREAKEEYDTVLREMRDPDFVDQFGMEKLASVKDLAKTEHASAEKKRKTLAAEVARLQKSIADAPVSRDQFVEMEAELCSFLTERGVPWADKGTPAEQIFGVFPSDKVIEKRVAAAAKFVSAEQEAMERRMELSALQSRPAATAAASATTTVAAATTEGPMPADAAPETPYRDAEVRPSESGEESVSAKYVANLASQAAEDEPNPFATPRSERKQSVLLSANSDMLNTLNKMFSGMASPSAKTPMLRARTPSRRASVAVTGASAAGGAALFMDKDADEGPKEIKQSKSKLLRRLMGGGGEESKAAAPRPMLSFLDQLKSRTGGASGDAAAPTGLPKPSFLDQLKARASGASGSDGDAAPKAKPSFLDQIRARASAQHGEEVDCTRAQTAAVPPMPPRPPMSFLDQIKARCKDQ